MNIKELSIGDWVQDRKGTTAQIIGIEEWSDGYELNIRINGINVGNAPALAVYSIPLSPEILERNGFVQLEPSANYDWWCLDNKDKFLVGFGFGKEEGRTATGWDFDTTGSCDYKRQIGVHELQNLLRLAGIEKEIELQCSSD